MKIRRINLIDRKEEVVDVYNLRHCDRKSFYGKAKIIETDSAYYLLSYSTIVCKWDKTTGTFTRFWSGESHTTTRHINAFLQDMGCWSAKVGGLAWWRKQEVTEPDSFTEDIKHSLYSFI